MTAEQASIITLVRAVRDLMDAVAVRNLAAAPLASDWSDPRYRAYCRLADAYEALYDLTARAASC